jgi:hypothetical protein
VRETRAEQHVEVVLTRKERTVEVSAGLVPLEPSPGIVLVLHDVTDRQWQVLEKLLVPAARCGRPPLDRRWVLNAILDVLRTGCQWRQLPKDFPPWKSVYTVF